MTSPSPSTSLQTHRIASGMSLEETHASRAEQRRQRLLEVELELAVEEAEALKMTEEQRQLLHRPFAAVKAEFTDLDGMRWTQTALRMRQPPQPQLHHQHRVPRQSETQTQTNGTFVVLTNADLASFAPEDTIRASSSSSSTSFPFSFSSHSTVAHHRLPLPSSPSIQTQLRDSAGTANLHTAIRSQVNTDLVYSTPKNNVNLHTLIPDANAKRHRDGTRTRSPIKGLFPTRQVANVSVSISGTGGTPGAGAGAGVSSSSLPAASSPLRQCYARPSPSPGPVQSQIDGIEEETDDEGEVQNHALRRRKAKNRGKTKSKSTPHLMLFAHRDAPSPPAPGLGSRARAPAAPAVVAVTVSSVLGTSSASLSMSTSTSSAEGAASLSPSLSPLNAGSADYAQVQLHGEKGQFEGEGEGDDALSSISLLDPPSPTSLTSPRNGTKDTDLCSRPASISISISDQLDPKPLTPPRVGSVVLADLLDSSPPLPTRGGSVLLEPLLSRNEEGSSDDEGEGEDDVVYDDFGFDSGSGSESDEEEEEGEEEESEDDEDGEEPDDSDLLARPPGLTPASCAGDGPSASLSLRSRSPRSRLHGLLSDDRAGAWAGGGGGVTLLSGAVSLSTAGLTSALIPNFIVNV